ncbi:MAG: hypothetical protein M1828_007356 [Chrysothrix sp. TS-e1954]|nr:MAG: hypothetical protein M1828_007356 [Chrysothrix sp. TS-e1954]
MPGDVGESSVPLKSTGNHQSRNKNEACVDVMLLWRSHLKSNAQQLSAFLQNPALFHLVSSIAAHSPSNDDTNNVKHHPFSKDGAPGTLFILDSSFNPPTRAHIALAVSALCPRPSSEEARAHTLRYPKPHRLLMLFSVHNATKSPAPAAFEQRLGMMQCASTDLAWLWQKTEKEYERYPQAPDGSYSDVHIDVGVTKEPYYHDKTRAIEDSGIYSRFDTSDESASPGPKHVHLIGWDTFMRVLDPKYYEDKHDPPLSALDHFFTKHELLVTLRADESAEGDGTLREQRNILDSFKRGDKQKEGLQPEWLTENKINVLDQGEESKLVSSTAVRNAVQKQDWDLVRKYCTPNVADWVKEMRPYDTEETGEKL